MGQGLRTFKYWIPALVWMAIIFGASGDALSSQRTLRFFAPLLRWIHRNMTDAQLATVMFYIRKGGHIFEYAVLAGLLWFALRHLKDPFHRRWSWSVAGNALLLSIAYAITDEFHQRFIPTRQGTSWDVLIDTCGAVLGLLIVYAFCKFREWRGRIRQAVKAAEPAEPAQ